MHIAVFPILVLIALVLIGGITGIVALLAHPKSRVAGAVLLGVMLVVLAVGGLGFFYLISYRHVARSQRVAVEPAQQAQMGASGTARTFDEFQRRVVEPQYGRPGNGSEGTIPLEAPTTPDPAERPSGAGTQAEPPGAEGTDSQADPKADANAPPDAGAEKPAEEPSAGAGDQAKKEKEEQPAATGVASDGPQPPKAEGPPAWVGKPPQSTGDVYRTTITTDPLRNAAECEGQLPDAVNQAVREYVETQLHRSSQVAQRVQLDLKTIQDKIVKERWLEPVRISLGEWKQLHALIEFDPQTKDRIVKECTLVQERLDQQREEAVVVDRLYYSGIGLAAVLALLAVAFACLKIDQVTERPCRGRLAVMAIVFLLAIGLSACLAIRYVDGRPRQFQQSVDWTPVKSVVYAPSEYSGRATLPAAVTSFKSVGWIVALPVALLLLGGIVALVAYKRTRVAGLVLLAVVVIGGLVLVSG